MFIILDGGLKGFYYDNVWFMDTPVIKIDNMINFDWGTSLITPNNSEFVSIRWIGAIYPPTTELYKFTIVYDDGVRIWISNTLVLDKWNSCCDPQSFTYSLTTNRFYDIKIEYMQKQGSAAIILYWESDSITKQIIPTHFLYYYTHAKNSPISLEVLHGVTFVPKSYATGEGLSKARVGTVASFVIQSCDAQGNPTNNINDAYQYNLEGPDGLSTGDINGTAVYDAVSNNGMYNVQYIPTIVGNYSLKVSLNGIQIKNSPFVVIVSIGDISTTYTLVSGITFPVSKVAGNSFTFQMQLYDVFNNRFITEPDVSPQISVLAVWNNSNAYISPIGITDTPGKNFAGKVTSNVDGSYIISITILKAGVFNLEIYLKNNPITLPSNTINITPSIIDPSRCVYKGLPTASIQSGTNTSVQIQCRDTYDNNIQSLLTTAITSSLIEFVDNTNIIYNETGTISDIAASAGCYKISFTPIRATSFVSNIIFNNIPTTSFKFAVSSTTFPSSTYSTALIDNLPTSSTYNAGSIILFKIKSYDVNNNFIATDISTSYSINVIGTNPSTSNTYTAVSLGAGEYNYEFIATQTNTYTLQVMLSGNNIINSPFNNIYVINTLADGKYSVLTQWYNTLAASPTPTKFIAKLNDKYNNYVGTTDKELVFLDFKNTSFPLYGLNTDSTVFYSAYSIGFHDFDVSFTTTGTYSFVLGVTNYGGLRATYYTTMNFLNPLNTIDLKYHNLGLYYTRIDKDINFGLGNTSFMVNYPNANISIKWEGFIKPIKSDLYYISVEVDGRIILIINDEILIDYTSYAQSNNNTSNINFTSIYLDSDKLLSFTVKYYKQTGSNTVKLMWQSDSIPTPTIIPSECLYYTTYSSQTPLSVNVSAAKTAPNTLKFISSYTSCITGVPNTINFKLYDSYNNLQTNTSDSITATIANDDQSISITPIITNTSGGTYNMQYTINTIGSYSLITNIIPTGDSATTILTNFDKINCITSNVDTTKTTVTGNGWTAATSGVIASFKVELYDTNNNLKKTAGDNLKVTIISSVETASDIYIRYDTLTYSYICEYIAYKTGQPYTITLTINGDTLNSLTSTMTLSADLPSNGNSLYTGLLSQYSTNTNYLFSIIIKDRYNNLPIAPYNIYSKFSGNFGTTSTYGVQDTSPLNKYNVSFNIPQLTGTKTGCGNTYLSSYLLKSGINRSYYNNYWLSGSIINNTIDTQLVFNWPTGVNVLSNYDKLYTSLLWNGYFKADYSENHTFIITTSNNVRLYIEDVLMLDSFNTGLQPFYQVQMTLVQNKIYSFNLSLFIAEQIANIKIEWYSASKSREVIPASNLFTNV